MKRSGVRLSGTILFLLFTACILTHSELSLSYASLGLRLWLDKMIPSLLPFMILSGIVIRLGLTENIASFAYPLIRPLYRVRKNVCYCMMLGFLCGFPMGARVVADLYSRGRLTREEGEYLLCFCNNIGPVYYCSFVLPLLHRELAVPYLFGMYGIPALYGVFLRYTRYRSLGNLLSERTIPPGRRGRFIFRQQPTPHSRAGLHKQPDFQDSSQSALIACEKKHDHLVRRGERLLSETDQAISAAIRSILTLGGYMILFNLMNLIPHVLCGKQIPLPAPLFEITGGLSMLQAQAPLYSLLALSFGGFSCIAQTYSCIRDTDLSIVDYTLHKVILTLLNALFYLCWSLLSPGSFLR
ncbi:MAG: hypothetical protein NC305_03545 [Lachnospiraceae bacterium]|nr:hypothetical protein [Butyrivibrio sp.]MCM1344203.1 hypothetical protein [Muribaculaceae bacterium]MCM1409604.1 hypothetical protein [Lachnospiraceae bacterium]